MTCGFLSGSRNFCELLWVSCEVLFLYGYAWINICEGGGDVVGVLTLLVGGVAQAFHDDQVVVLRVQLGVQEVVRKEDRVGQVEVERERRLKEVRPWMTMEMK